MNLAHIKLISLFIIALCKAKTVSFIKLAACFESKATADSCLRRIQRFFAKYSFDSDLVAKFIFQQLPLKGPYKLAIDRTNWQFGSTNINIFMLAVIYEGVSYPLLFNMLDKKGTSNTEERIKLIKRYINLFGRESIEYLLADREFVGEKWIKWLNDNKICYYIRIRDSFWVKVPKTGKLIKASWIFNNLKIGESRFINKIYYVNNQACYLAGSRIKGHDGNPELQIIISYNKIEKGISAYKQRWQIETMFKAMKSAGFNIEDTHLYKLDRIEKLMLLVMIAFVWCYNVGELVHRKIKPIPILKHGKKRKSIFRYGLDIVTEIIMGRKNKYKIPIFNPQEIVLQILDYT